MTILSDHPRALSLTLCATQVHTMRLPLHKNCAVYSIITLHMYMTHCLQYMQRVQVADGVHVGAQPSNGRPAHAERACVQALR